MHACSACLADDIKGGIDPVPWILRVGSIGWACDMLGAAEIGPWPEGFTARHPCRNCWWTPSCPCAYLPPAQAQNVMHSDHCRHSALRTMSELEADLDVLRTAACSATELKKQMSAKGISKLFFLLDPRLPVPKPHE
jgi:hypothetical protein